MLTHVLQSPISVYLPRDRANKSLTNIGDYGQEYGVAHVPFHSAYNVVINRFGWC
jgi:hypothetical protein